MDKVYNVYVFLCWDIVYLKQCHADIMWAVFSLQNSRATVVLKIQLNMIPELTMKLLCMEMFFSKVAASHETKSPLKNNKKHY